MPWIYDNRSLTCSDRLLVVRNAHMNELGTSDEYSTNSH